MTDDVVFLDMVPAQDPDTVPPAVESPLAALVARARARDAQRAPEVTLPIPSLDGVHVRFRTRISAAQLRAWRQAAHDRRTKEVDTLRLARLVIAHTAVAVIVDGEEVGVTDDDAGVFALPEVRAMVGVKSSTEAVQALYGLDPDVVVTAERVLTEAGWGDDGQRLADPDPR